LSAGSWNSVAGAGMQVDVEAGEELACSAESCFRLHGRNIELSDDGMSAERTASYNHGLVISRHPLRPGRVFRVSELFCSSSL